MKIGDLVMSLVSQTDECQAGILLSIYREGAMILWDHGEICWSPLKELEVIS